MGRMHAFEACPHTGNRSIRSLHTLLADFLAGSPGVSSLSSNPIFLDVGLVLLVVHRPRAFRDPENPTYAVICTRHRSVAIMSWTARRNSSGNGASRPKTPPPPPSKNPSSFSRARQLTSKRVSIATVTANPGSSPRSDRRELLFPAHGITGVSVADGREIGRSRYGTR